MATSTRIRGGRLVHPEKVVFCELWERSGDHAYAGSSGARLMQPPSAFTADPMNQTTELHWVDYLIIVIYFCFVLGIGFFLRRFMRTSSDFLASARSTTRLYSFS